MRDEALTTADLAGTATRDNRDDMQSEQRFDGPGAARARSEDGFSGPLLPQDATEEMRHRWESVQASFVDDPRVAVQQADELVASAMKRLAETFAHERQNLEQQWSRGGDVSTEDLRQALRRYRAFFQRLLSV
jgi:hypothetical protein